MKLSSLISDLEQDEGKEALAYTDTVGKITVGVGHNLANNPLSDEAIRFILIEDILDCVLDLEKYPFWALANDARQNALINIRFNLGATGFAKFKNAITNANLGLWDDAANEFMDSKWYAQVGGRGPKVVHQIRHGVYR